MWRSPGQSSAVAEQVVNSFRPNDQCEPDHQQGPLGTHPRVPLGRICSIQPDRPLRGR